MITEKEQQTIQPVESHLGEGPLYMYLAYMDDYGTRDKQQRFQLLTAVVIPDRWFHAAQSLAISGLATHIPDAKAEEFWAKFEEFKGWQLFNGHGPFEILDQATRFWIIESLLDLVREFNFSIIYGALQKDRLGHFVSVNPLDVCFRICMEGIADLVKREPDGREFAMLIADNSNKDSKALRDSFYEFRKQMGRPGLEPFPTPHLHDDMYFGDSKYSIGIQLADLCGYFIAKHLQGDPAGEGFYSQIKDHIVYSRIEPKIEQ